MDEKKEQKHQDERVVQAEYVKKFEFFFLAVVVGAFAFSIQTFESTEVYESVYLMYITWLLLGISFIAGFFRQERMILLLTLNVTDISSESVFKLVEKAIDKQKELEDVDKTIVGKYGSKEFNSMLNIGKNMFKTRRSIFEKHSRFAYQIHKWAFFLAMFSYMLFKISNIESSIRGYEPWVLISITILTFIISRFYKLYCNKKEGIKDLEYWQNKINQDKLAQ